MPELSHASKTKSLAISVCFFPTVTTSTKYTS